MWPDLSKKLCDGNFHTMDILLKLPVYSVIVRQEGRIGSIDFKLGETLALIFLVTHPGGLMKRELAGLFHVLVLCGDVEVLEHVGEEFKGGPLGGITVPTLEHYLQWTGQSMTTKGYCYSNFLIWAPRAHTFSDPAHA